MTQVAGFSKTAAVEDVGESVVMSTGDVRSPLKRDDHSDAVFHMRHQLYPNPIGEIGLRRAIAQRTSPKGLLDCDNVLIAPGARLAIFVALSATSRGGEVLLPAPYWASYPELIRAAGANPVIVPGRAGVFECDVHVLEAHRTKSTTMVVINSPRNPDGATIDMAMLDAIVEWAHCHGIVVLFDQVYRGVSLSSECAVSVVDHWDRFADDCVVVDGLTKSHALGGIRVGWAIATGERFAACAAIASHLFGGVSAPSQDIAASALADKHQVGDAVASVVAANLRIATEVLADVSGVKLPLPEHGIFCFMDLREWLDTYAPDEAQDDVALWLRDIHGVVVVDGNEFGVPGHVRISAALESAEFEKGISRLAAAFRTVATTERQQ